MISSYIGYSLDNDIRFKSTSGGIGTSLLKYLFEGNHIQTSVSFDFNQTSLQYFPKLIYDFENYKITGSIYHEIDMLSYLKSNLSFIKGRIFIFLLPCQVQPILRLLKKNNIEHFIVALTCSSQQSIEATYFLLKKLNIDKNLIECIKYRGNGWPSGINIKLENSENIYISNNDSIWTTIFHSRLFIQKRCFSCKETISAKADICLADPWLKKFIETDKIGQTLIVANSEEGENFLLRANGNKKIIIEKVDNDLIINTQRKTIQRKELYINKKKYIYIVARIIRSPLYRYLVLKSNLLFRIHCKIIFFFEYHLNKIK